MANFSIFFYDRGRCPDVRAPSPGPTDQPALHRRGAPAAAVLQSPSRPRRQLRGPRRPAPPLGWQGAEALESVAGQGRNECRVRSVSVRFPSDGPVIADLAPSKQQEYCPLLREKYGRKRGNLIKCIRVEGCPPFAYLTGKPNFAKVSQKCLLDSPTLLPCLTIYPLPQCC